jgi:hypothetical protein
MSVRQSAQQLVGVIVLGRRPGDAPYEEDALMACN